MNLLDLLKATGGGDSVGQIAESVGLGSSDTSKLVEALAPALMRGLQKNTASDDGLAGLRHALDAIVMHDELEQPTGTKRLE